VRVALRDRHARSAVLGLRKLMGELVRPENPHVHGLYDEAEQLGRDAAQPHAGDTRARLVNKRENDDPQILERAVEGRSVHRRN
jgi:hypothetical protein